MKRFAIVVAVISVFGMVGSASADLIMSADSVTTNMGALITTSPNTLVGHIIDQSGLSSSFASGVDDFDTYIAGDPTHLSAHGNDWVSSSGVLIGNIDFDLGGALVVDKVALWNQSLKVPDRTATGVSSINILASLQSDFAVSTDLGTFSIDQATANPTPGQVLTFGDTVAQYVRFEILGNYGGSFGVTSLGEVAFSVSPVPVPGAFLLGGIGLACASLRMRRRKAKQGN